MIHDLISELNHVDYTTSCKYKKNKANSPTMRPQHFALYLGGGRGGSGGGSSDGGGNSGGVAGGQGISWDHPRLENRSVLPFSKKA